MEIKEEVRRARQEVLIRKAVNKLMPCIIRREYEAARVLLSLITEYIKEMEGNKVTKFYKFPSYNKYKEPENAPKD